MMLGLGNPDLADDGAGILIAKRLRSLLESHVYFETEKSIESLVIQNLDNPDIQIFCFIDAVDFSEESGSWRFFTYEDLDKFILPVSTHKVPFQILANLIVENNKTFLLMGIQPKSLEWMASPSAEVLSAIEEIVSFFNSLK